MNTVLHRLAEWAKEAPLAPAQRFKQNGVWKTLSARDYLDRVLWIAAFLEGRGISAQECACILSYNCPEWAHVDLGAMLAGLRSAGVYPNSTPKDILYILNHTDSTVLSVQDKDYYSKIIEGGGLPARVKLVLVFDGDTSISPKAVAWEDALAEGRKRVAEHPGLLERFLGRIDPDAPAFLIYTSGTTGNPKGALISHDNLAFATDIAVRFWKLPKNEEIFSFLPLCHIAEKIQSIGAGLTLRYLTSYCTKFDNLAQEITEVNPTVLLCVPRLWEKMMEGVQNKISRGSGAKKQLALWALDAGARVARAKFSGARPGFLDLIQYGIADRLVLSKVREALGLKRAKVLASGAAALPPHVAVWFRSLGLEILEDYGQTESTAIICMTEPGRESSGTVGKPVTGTEFKLAPDGEILTRGRHVFKGYLKDDASTAATLDADGWLHSGDLGEWTAEGLVRIRGRKKEILKTSNGKMVAPAPIEEKLKATPIVSQVCMVGDGRKYCSALITLSEGKLAELKSQGHLGTKAEAKTIEDPATVGEIKRAVDELNKGLASHEQIKRFAILSREFSIADEEMTATLKMKRAVVEAHFKDVIDSLYA